MIEIAFLADHPETIPTLAHWFRAQWPGYYNERAPAEIAQDFAAEAHRTRIPLRLVAFADGKLAGTITLRERALQALPEYQPGLGGLFVAERFRGRGIGTELVRAGTHVARELGYERVYTATVTARGIVEHLGWQLCKTVTHGDGQQLLYAYALHEAHDSPPQT